MVFQEIFFILLFNLIDTAKSTIKHKAFLVLINYSLIPVLRRRSFELIGSSFGFNARLFIFGCSKRIID